MQLYILDSCKEAAQPIRDESCPHLPSKSITDDDYITNVRADMSSKRSAVNPSECKSVAKKSHISVTLEKKMEVIHRMGDCEARRNICRSTKLPLSTMSTIMKK